MKKIISLLLAVVMIACVCLSFCACSSIRKSDVVGVWKTEMEHPSYMDFVYIYKDGTGDQYGKAIDKVSHHNSFEWEIEGEYFCFHYSYGKTEKYTVKDGKMYDRQGNLAFVFCTSDTSKDVLIY